MINYLDISFGLLLIGIGSYFVIYKNRLKDKGFEDSEVKE